MTSPTTSNTHTPASEVPAFEAMTFRAFLDLLAAKTPAPGGGAAASAAGAIAASLARMVVNYSFGKKMLSQHEPMLRSAFDRLRLAADLLMKLADEDAAAYGTVNELSRLPEADPRRAGLAIAQAAAVQIPLAVMAACVDMLILMKDLTATTNRQLRSDLGISAVIAEAASRSSWWNVFINAGFITDEKQRTAWLAEANRMRDHSVDLARDVEKACAA